MMEYMQSMMGGLCGVGMLLGGALGILLTVILVLVIILLIKHINK